MPRICRGIHGAPLETPGESADNTYTSRCLVLLVCLRLFVCSLWTSLVTCGATLYLSNESLSAIADDNRLQNGWFMRKGRNTLAACVRIASLSRIESLAILRLRLCGKMRIEAPISHRHFHFLRYEGMYHYILEDVPHICVALAQLMLTPDDREVCGQEHHLLQSLGSWLPWTLSADKTGELVKFLAWASIATSARRPP